MTRRPAIEDEPRPCSHFRPRSVEKSTWRAHRKDFRKAASVEFYSDGPVLILGEIHRVCRMMRMGPEALLVRSRTAPRADLVEYGRLEYARSEVL
jgi:hypothetical protein